MSGGLYNPYLTPQALKILAALQEVGQALRKKEDPTREQLVDVASLIEEALGTPDLDLRNPQILQMITSWNQLLLGCLLKRLDPNPYTGLIDLVFPELTPAEEFREILSEVNTRTPRVSTDDDPE